MPVLNNSPTPEEASELFRQYQEFLHSMEKQKMALGWPKAPPTPPPPPTWQQAAGMPGNIAQKGYSSNELCRMVAMRMRWSEGVELPMKFMEAHRHNDRVFVFIVYNGDAMTFEDEWPLFPSDAFITKLRLMLG